MRTLVFGLLFVCLCRSELGADMSVADYQKNMRSNDRGKVEVTKVYIFGLGEGIRVANVMLVLKGDNPLFCSPPKLVFVTENFINILDQAIKEASQQLSPVELSETEVSVILAKGLMDSFPCGPGKH